MRPIPDRAVTFVGQLEGCELVAYPDPASGGDPWTVGYGHTGPDVRPGMKITNAQAINFLRADLATARSRIYRRIGEVADELSEPQFCALLSFVLNLGDGDPKKKEWDIWKILRARQFDQVPAQLARFNKAAGTVNKGLVNRRAAEQRLWAEDAAPALPSSTTRSIPTPPTPADTKPLAKSKSFMTGLATFGLTAAAFVSDHIKPILDAISPFAASSETIGRVQSTLVTLAAGAAAATVVFVWLKRRHQS